MRKSNWIIETPNRDEHSKTYLETTTYNSWKGSMAIATPISLGLSWPFTAVPLPQGLFHWASVGGVPGSSNSHQRQLSAKDAAHTSEG